MNNFSKRLKFLRKGHLDLTLKEFAAPLKLSFGYISDLERGAAKNPSEPLLKAIAATYEINYDWLVHGDGPMLAEKKPQPVDPAPVSAPPQAAPVAGGHDLDTLIGMCTAVLTSRTHYAKALAENIRSFRESLRIIDDNREQAQVLTIAVEEIKKLKEECTALKLKLEEMERKMPGATGTGE